VHCHGTGCEHLRIFDIAECILKPCFNGIISLICCYWNKSKQIDSLMQIHEALASTLELFVFFGLGVELA